ncbi:MAG: helix-turn-helix transcriptional regulator, partial [Lachnospiraceae bacterium]|nr:helix-turn-helix transcriptional regulator [Lachnospiraceae bacterium]
RDLMEKYKQEIGARLKQARREKDLTQEKFSEMLGISQKHYSEVERGITGLSVEKLIFLSNFFGISVDYLLKGEKDKDILPFVLIDVYESCPEENRTLLLDMLKSLNKLLHSSPDAAE